MRVSDILILARVRIHELDVPIITDYYFDVKERLSTVEGCFGLSVWRDQRDPESFLVVYEYADLEAADRGLVAISEIRVLAESQTAAFRPADVQRLRLKKYSGKRLSKTATTAVLSLSQRVADPGYSPELVEELERIFVELELIPGYLGSVIGENDILEEEIFGLVTWQNRESFLASLPPSILSYDISLYGRFY